MLGGVVNRVDHDAAAATERPEVLRAPLLVSGEQQTLAFLRLGTCRIRKSGLHTSRRAEMGDGDTATTRGWVGGWVGLAGWVGLGGEL